MQVVLSAEELGCKTHCFILNVYISDHSLNRREKHQLVSKKVFSWWQKHISNQSRGKSSLPLRPYYNYSTITLPCNNELYRHWHIKYSLWLIVTCRCFFKFSHFTSFSDLEPIASTLRWLVNPCSIPSSLNYLVFNMIENVSLRQTKIISYRLI